MISQVAHRYGRALFDLALEQGKSSYVEADLIVLSKILSLDSNILRAMSNPLFPIKEQLLAVKEISEKADMVELVQNFLCLLVSQRRLGYINDIIASYLSFAVSFRKELPVNFISSHDLSETSQEKLEDTVKKALNRNILSKFTVDKNLLDGFVIQIGTRWIDFSLKTRLNVLERTLKEAY